MISKPKRVILALAVIGLLLLCAFAAGIYWGTGPSLRCKLPAEGQAQPGWSARTVISGGLARCYYLYTPPGSEPDQQVPVVVSLHGYLSNPESHALITGWHKLADREGFLVVYPQATQYPQRWNAGRDWGSQVDDVQFLRDILDDLLTVAPVDKERTYVNGFSNGGGMTVRAGCELADTIAAIGTVAAAVVSLDDCNPARPLPLLAFQGTEDPLVAHGGGGLKGPVLPTAAVATRAPGSFMGFEEWVGVWAEGNGCDPLPQSIPSQGDVHGARYLGCTDDAEVIRYTIEGGGHTWPGGWPIPVVGKTTFDIDATEEMWNFFQAHPLHSQP